MLEKPKRYFPLEKGLYEIAPGLRSLASERMIEIDDQYPKYLENRRQCRSERLSKYLCQSDYLPEVSSAVNRFLIERMCLDQPQHFSKSSVSMGGLELLCKLTGETLRFDQNFELTSLTGGTAHPAYVSGFDALCSQLQEDVAIMSTAPGGKNWLSAIHLCSPGHWSAEDKIGQDFFAIHTPVPGIEKINRAAASFVDAMVNKGPYTRFVWGFGTDSRLNHHPLPPPGHDPAEWKGRSFNRARQGSPFILRVERQVLHGLPHVGASVFTIRISFIDGEEIRANPQERALLRSALLSMTPESRIYKGVDKSMDQIIAWLDEQNS